MKPEKPQDDSSPDELGECAPNGSSLGSEPLPPKLQSVVDGITHETITSTGAAFAKECLHRHEQLHAARMMEYINTTDRLAKRQPASIDEIQQNVHRSIQAPTRNERMTFSDQEIKLLDLVSTGATSSEIASKMDYTEGTIRVYLHKLYRKLDVRNRTEAAVWWLKEKSKCG